MTEQEKKSITLTREAIVTHESLWFQLTSNIPQINNTDHLVNKPGKGHCVIDNRRL